MLKKAKDYNIICIYKPTLGKLGVVHVPLENILAVIFSHVELNRFAVVYWGSI